MQGREAAPHDVRLFRQAVTLKTDRSARLTNHHRTMLPLYRKQLPSLRLASSSSPLFVCVLLLFEMKEIPIILEDISHPGLAPAAVVVVAAKACSTLKLLFYHHRSFNVLNSFTTLSCSCTELKAAELSDSCSILLSYT